MHIKNYKTGAILYQDNGTNMKECAERAVLDHIDLSYADFRHANLSNACIDEAILTHADFTGANLLGANLSEARLSHATFNNSYLHSVCLCHASLDNCSFDGTLFGGTDIAGAVLDGGQFTTSSSLALNFIEAATLRACEFQDAFGIRTVFSRAPLTVTGLVLPVTFFDDHLKIGGTMQTYQAWFQTANDNGGDGNVIRPASLLSRREGLVHSFFKAHLDLLKVLAREHAVNGQLATRAKNL